MAVSVAILYAGRWFGRAGQLSMTPRLSHVLHALPVSVFLVVRLQTSGAPPLAPMTRWPRCVQARCSVQV